MVNVSILFLALEYWDSDNSNNAIYKVSSHKVFRDLVCSILVSVENMKLVEMCWQNKPLIFSSNQNLDKPKIPKYAFIFDLSRHAKSSLTATTGFVSSTRVAITKSFHFRGVLVLITTLSVPCNWFLMVQKSHEVFFNMESSRFSKPRFPTTTNLMPYFKVSI